VRLLQRGEVCSHDYAWYHSAAPVCPLVQITVIGDVDGDVLPTEATEQGNVRPAKDPPREKILRCALAFVAREVEFPLRAADEIAISQFAIPPCLFKPITKS